jgi:peptidoglycan-N-acetylglucosamine deacetylase
MTASFRPVFYDPRGRRAQATLAVALVALLFALVVGAVVLVGLMARPQLSGLDGEPESQPILGTDRIPVIASGEQSFSPLHSRSLPTSAANVKRLAYFADYDDRSVTSLKRFAAELDGILPSWLSIIDTKGNISEVDSNEHAIHNWLRSNASHIRVYPLLSSDLSAAATVMVIATGNRRAKIARAVADYLAKYGLDGIAISLHQLPPTSHASLVALLSEVSQQVRPAGRKVMMEIEAGYDAVRMRDFTPYVDQFLLTTFDATRSDGKPGPVASQGWFEDQLSQVQHQIDPAKLIVGIGSFGYQWIGVGTQRQISVQEAWNLLDRSKAPLFFDRRTLNSGFRYVGADELKHEIWLLDGVTVFNQTRAALAINPAGVALWRLGLEDSSAWQSFGRRRLPDQKATERLSTILPGYDVPGFAPGDALAAETYGGPGVRTVTFDPNLGLIVSQAMKEMPGSFRLASWGPRPEKTIALTFDDGPDATYTPAILDILREKSVRATFFVIGRNVVREPNLVQRIYDEGHDLGNHTFTHPDLSLRTAREIELELSATQRALEAQLGVRTILFRAPLAHPRSGSDPETARIMEIATRLGYVSVRVSIQPTDWAPFGTAKKLKESVIRQAVAGGGRVVLLHDGGGNRSVTAEALPGIIDELKARDFRFVTMHELLERPRAQIMPTVDGVDPLSVALTRFAWAGVRSFSWVWEWLPAVAVLSTILGIVRLGFIIVFAYRHKRMEEARRGLSWSAPSVSVLVPAYNEEKVICKTIASLLRSRCPNLDILVIDDGSSDATAAVVRSTFFNDARVRVLTKANGGKSAALNFGLVQTNAEIVVAIDADTILEDDAIELLLRHFGDPDVGAVAGSAVVGNQVTLMTRLQALEYVTSQNLDRRAFECFNAIGVVPGAIGAWRRTALVRIGGYSHDTLAEDADVTIAIERGGWKVFYEPRAVALTEAPETVRAFLKQRFRWMFGTLQVAFKHSGAMFTYKPTNVGLLTIPNILVFQFAFTLLAPLMDIVLILTVADNIRELFVHGGEAIPDDLVVIARYWLLFQLVDILAAAAGMNLEPKHKCRHLLPLLFVQRFCYRQLLYVVAVRAIVVAAKGRLVGWGKLLRTGNVSVQLGNASLSREYIS